MTTLTGKNVKFEWLDTCKKSFQELRKRIVMAPVLTIPDEVESFVIYSDAPNQGLGAVLIQHGIVIAYASR